MIKRLPYPHVTKMSILSPIDTIAPMETGVTPDVQVEQLPTGNDKTSVTKAYII